MEGNARRARTRFHRMSLIALLAQARAVDVVSGAEKEGVAALGLPSDPDRLREMQKSWDTGNEGLGVLRDRIDATVEKLERARRAVEVLEERG